MLNLKKTAVAVLALGSSAVFAGTMGPVCAPGAVTVPCEKQAWGFGVQALYLQANTNQQLAFLDSYTVGTNTTFVDSEPKWGWGFKLEGAYHFSTGNDLNLNWYHFSKKTTRTYLGNNFGSFPTPVSYIDTIKPQWDAVNLEFGQHVDFGQYKKIRFHGGVQYARLKNTYTDFTASSGSTSYPAGSLVNETTFNGFGPRMGADMSYDFGGGFAVYGNSATSLLIGSSKFNSRLNNLAGGTVARATGSFTTVVPELEAKLGAKYDYAMAQGDLTLDAGYMWVNYFNGLNNFEANTTATLSKFSSNNRSSDMSLTGPYLGLKWVGNM